MTSRRCDAATFQRRDVESQHRDVTEKAQNAQKIQQRSKMKGNFPHEIVTLWNLMTYLD